MNHWRIPACDKFIQINVIKYKTNGSGVWLKFQIFHAIDFSNKFTLYNKQSDKYFAKYGWYVISIWIYLFCLLEAAVFAVATSADDAWWSDSISQSSVILTVPSIIHQ